MPAASSIQLLDLHRAAHRGIEMARANAEAVRARDESLARGQALMRALVARYRRLSADPRGIDRELLAACEAWAGEEEG